MPLRLITLAMPTAPSGPMHLGGVVVAKSVQAKEVGTVKEVTPAGMSMRRGSSPGALTL
jgi:hypothetical protein